jgi:hypothetical protein
MSNEFFYLDADGKKCDSGLHEDILDNPEADFFSRLLSFHAVVTEGIFSPAKAMEVYRITEKDLKSPQNIEAIAIRTKSGKPSYNPAG